MYYILLNENNVPSEDIIQNKLDVISNLFFKPKTIYQRVFENIKDFTLLTTIIALSVVAYFYISKNSKNWKNNKNKVKDITLTFSPILTDLFFHDRKMIEYDKSLKFKKPFLTFLEKAVFYTAKLTNNFKRTIERWKTIDNVESAKTFTFKTISFIVGIVCGYYISKKLNIMPSNLSLNISMLTLFIIGLFNYEKTIETTYEEGFKQSVKEINLILYSEELLEKLKKSENKVDRAIYVVYTKIINYIPKFKNHKLKLYTYNDKDDFMNMWVSIHKEFLIFVVVNPDIWIKLCTQEEIEGVILHEIGHILTIKRDTLVNRLTFNYFLDYIKYLIALTMITFSKQNVFLSMCANIIIMLIFGLYKSYKKIDQEIKADSLPIILGYAKSIKSLHFKIQKIIEKTIKNATKEKTGNYYYLDHFLNTTPIRLNILDKMIEEYNKLITKET